MTEWPAPRIAVQSVGGGRLSSRIHSMLTAATCATKSVVTVTESNLNIAMVALEPIRFAVTSRPT